MTPELEREMQLRAMAGANERRNRPRALIMGAGALLALASLYAGWSALEARAARAELEGATRQAGAVRRILGQMEAVRTDPARRLDPSRYAPDTQILAKLTQRIPDQLGMTARPVVNEGRTVPFAADSKLSSRSVRAIFSDVPLEQAMQWINSAVQEVRGLHVTNIEFMPTRDRGWSITVELSRWESRP